MFCSVLFLLFHKNICCGTHKKHLGLNKVLLMSIHNICSLWEMRQISCWCLSYLEFWNGTLRDNIVLYLVIKWCLIKTEIWKTRKQVNLHMYSLFSFCTSHMPYTNIIESITISISHWNSPIYRTLVWPFPSLKETGTLVFRWVMAIDCCKKKFPLNTEIMDFCHILHMDLYWHGLGWGM